MWFRKVTAGAFGRLRDETLRFGGALNIVYGPNESGKSTWHAALTVALCGLRHGSGRTNVERDFKRRRQPWDDPDRWHVNLEVELDDGRIIEIDRDLNDARTTTLDVGMGGREVTDDLMNQGSPDGAKWLGLDRTTFPMTASVNQADVLSILDLGNNERHALQEHLAQAAAGGRGGTAAGAIECIRKFAAENVGADRRNARKPLRLAMNSVERAESQLSRTQERRQEYVGLVRRVDRNRRMVRVLESRQAALRALLARDEAEERANHLVKRVTRLEEWESRFFDGDPRALGEARSAELVIALSLDPPFGVCGCGDVGVLGLWSVAGGGFVRVREVLAGFGRFLGVFGRVWSAWGRAEPVGDVLLMVCLVGSVRGQQSCGRLRTPARAV